MHARFFFSSSSASPRLTLRQRFEASWWCERVELSDLKPRGGMLSVCRSERVRPLVASLSLFAFLGSQCVLPGAFLLSEVRADEARRTQMTQAQEKAREAKTPAWAKRLRSQIAQEKAEREARLVEGAPRRSEDASLRLAQGAKRPVRRTGAAGRTGAARAAVIAVPGSRPGQVAPSADNGSCLDCQVDVRALDLSKVPSERDLRRAGQLGGALTPLRPAEPREVEARLDLILKRAGIEAGLKATLPETNRPGRLLAQAKKKAKHAKDINLDFGKAIQEWNKHNYRVAARMFEKHVKDYPDSPWTGEAELHLGCDAKYNGRFAEAQQRYDALFKKTSSRPNKKAEAARAIHARTPAEANAIIAGQVTELLARVESPEAAVEAVFGTLDLSFEIHQKAKLRWADLDIATGRVDEAAAKLADIIKTDTDWRRVTWAQHWLRNVFSFQRNARGLRACGPKALSVVLASLGQAKAAEELKRMLPPSERGMDIGELEKLARRYNVAMRGFQSKPELLASLPMPLVLHYDFSPNTPSAKTSTAKTSTPKASTAKAASLKTVALKAAVKTPFRVEHRAGHFVVARRVDAAKREVTLFDPQEGRVYTLSFAQLAREWSGAGLVLDKGGKGATRLTAAQKAKAVGGCCGLPTAPGNLGDDPGNMDDARDPCDPEESRAEPSVSINRITMNMFVKDTPLWYSTPVGPDVNITMSYNSQDATTQNTPFGNKWTFNYGSYLVEDTAAGGGRVTIFMSDGRQDNYTPDGSGGYINEIGTYSRLVKLGTNSWELRFRGGDKWIYDIPQGTTSLQPFLVEQRNRLGYGLRFGYDENVRLTTITDAQNKVTRLQYDAQGHIVRVWDPFGRHASFSYDANGNMIEAVDVEGHAFQYTYDSLVRITQLNTAQGPWKFHHEGPDGDSSVSDTYPAPDGPMWASIRLTVTDPANQKEEYFYYAGWGYDTDGISDERSWHVSKNHYVNYTPQHNNASGNVPKTQWDTGEGASNQGELIGNKGKIRIISNAAGEKTYIDYDPESGLPIAVTDARGKITRTTYNALSRPLSVTDPKGNISTVSYAPNGLDVTGITNANGVVLASYTYNNKHQITSATGRSGTTTFTYTAWGAPATVTDPQGTTTYTYNSAARLASVARDGVTLGGFTYDEKGRLKTATDATGLTIAYEYNNLDAVTKVSYPDGTSEETDYACCGLPGVVKDRSGRRAYYDYDALKRLVRVQDAAGNTLQMDYDRDNNLTRLLDAKGNSTRWAYDAVGRVKEKRYHDGTREAATYSNGLLSQSRGARGQVVSYAYDDNGNVTGIDYPNMADVSFVYNKLNQVTSITDGVGTHGFNYDGYGRINGLNGPLTNDGQSFSYDALGRLQSQSVERGASGGTQTQSYAFDALQRLQTLTSSGTQGAGTFTYNYVGDTGMMARLDLPNGAKVEQSYDNLHRLTLARNLGAGNANLASYAYGYDDRDVKTGVQAQLGSDPLQQIAYAYDVVDQLTGESATGGVAGRAYSNVFQYDAMGNRTKLENVAAQNTRVTNSAANQLNQLTALSSSLNGGATLNTDLVYDVGGNLTQATGSDGSKTIYSYDDGDRLIRIENRDAANLPLSKSEFVYDYAARKAVSREFSYQNGAWVKTGETRRVFDGLDVVQERNDQNQVTAQYVREGNIGGILARTSQSGHSYFHYDGGGNVTALSDENGALVGRYSYDAFGNTLEASGPRASENPYRFSTKEHHAASGMVDYGYRFYSPGMGRWLNRDPIRESGGFNVYAFVENSPTNDVDAYGLNPLSEWWDGIRCDVDRWLDPPSQRPSPNDDEPGDDSIRLAEEIGDRHGHVRDRGAELWEGGANVVMSVAPVPVPRPIPRPIRFRPRPIRGLGPMCFVAGTPIVMGDGSTKAIEQVKEGDKVLSRDEKSGKTEVKKVTRTFERQTDATLVLHFQGGQRVETTKEHPFYVEGRGFVPAGEMGIGTSIVTRAGPSAKLEKVEVKNTTATVYNFEVEGFHTYFVGQDGLWVHNRCPRLNPRAQSAHDPTAPGFNPIDPRNGLPRGQLDPRALPPGVSPQDVAEMAWNNPISGGPNRIVSEMPFPVNSSGHTWVDMRFRNDGSNAHMWGIPRPSFVP